MGVILACEATDRLTRCSRDGACEVDACREQQQLGQCIETACRGMLACENTIRYAKSLASCMETEKSALTCSKALREQMMAEVPWDDLAAVVEKNKASSASGSRKR